MSAHTPGPWHLSPTGRFVRYGSDTMAPNVCDLGLEMTDEDHANARLIAAAPDLLASTRELLFKGHSCECDLCLPLTVAVETAIAKAEGR